MVCNNLHLGRVDGADELRGVEPGVVTGAEGGARVIKVVQAQPWQGKKWLTATLKIMCQYILNKK